MNPQGVEQLHESKLQVQIQKSLNKKSNKNTAIKLYPVKQHYTLGFGV